MIIPPQKLEQFDRKHAELHVRHAIVDPPPEYEPRDPNTARTDVNDDVRLPEGKPMNQVHRHLYFDPINGSFIIDPELQVPSTFSMSRKNLFLQSDCGPVNVDVWVLSNAQRPPQFNPWRKVSLSFRTMFGPITVKLHTSPSSSSLTSLHTPTRRPISLTASSQCGPISVHIPKSFHGILSLSATLAPISLSQKVQSKIEWDSDFSGGTFGSIPGRRRKVFIGDRSVLQGEGTWDEVVLDATCGPINVGYVDELNDFVPDVPPLD